MFNYMNILDMELRGIYGDQLEKINKINRWYEIYDGKQEWDTAYDLDYVPTKKITNHIKKLIDKRARFMFGKEVMFNIISENKEQEQAKEELLYKILEENKFHQKILKARKDCSIGGKVAIKLWASKEEGLKIIFCPAQEFFAVYDIDDVDKLEKVLFVYATNDEQDREKQRIKKQIWEMQNNRCILNEATYNGKGEVVSVEYENYDTQLDFIPVIPIRNGGLTGEVEGKSDVEDLWSNANVYNKLTSDDVDALRFQMFGQDVFTDVAEKSLAKIKIAPGAMIDLQTEPTAPDGCKADVKRHESSFSYTDKFVDTVNRIKNDMYETMDVPNVSLEQLKGLMQSGKSMKALYWDLIAACEEDWTEWGPALQQMVEYIFKMVEIYDLYEAREIARYETELKIEHSYPIPEDEFEKKQMDLQEVLQQVRSRKNYIKKYNVADDVEEEFRQILEEDAALKDDPYMDSINRALEGGDGAD